MIELVIELPLDQRKAITAHVEADYPNEACGLLLGQKNGAHAIVHQTVASDNIADEPSHRFEIDPGLRLTLQKAARDGGDIILGHYHSHPNGAAMPSKTDQAGIYEADLVWLIAAVADGEMQNLAAFMPWADCGGFDEIELRDID
ncbi:MAG: M67 family metallopeptidase [Alphaproteobacteria bacterium]|nr:M67 family metallopeptidase [Alphaproteobacteria bacterium]